MALSADADMVAEVTARVRRAHAIVAATNPATESPTPRKPRVTRTSSVEGVDANVATRTANGRVSTADRVAKAMAKTPDASAAQIAAKLGYSERTVQRYQRQFTIPVATVTTSPVGASA
jgi:hypothetical protein